MIAVVSSKAAPTNARQSVITREYTKHIMADLHFFTDASLIKANRGERGVIMDNNLGNAVPKMELDAEGIKKLVRFELDPEIFTEESNLDLYEDIAFTGTYRLTYQDLVAACRNMIRCNINQDMLASWFFFVTEENYNEYFEGAWIGRGAYEYLWPGNDDALFDCIKNLIDDISFDYEYGTPEEIKKGLEEAFLMAEYYEANKGKAAADRKMTPYQIEHALIAFCGTTEHVPSSKKALFKRIVDEECEKENEIAMSIKGYGCYGGDRIYECDWEESRKWITKLFEKTGNPNYANTLGYIYYYGRCNNGEPEYEKAFQYFSVGAAHHLLESMYKQADMFLYGRGCIKSPETSDYIIENLYDECEVRFCHGEDAKFADIALRMGAKFRRREKYMEALYYYLQADYAIKKRLKKSDFFGDKKVQENITKSIQEVKSKIPADYFKEEIKSRNPFWLFDMLDMDCNAKVEIQFVGDNRYKILIDRRKKDHPGKALIVAPELESATLTRVFETEFITKEPIEYFCKDKNSMYVTNISYCNENEYTFCNADVDIFLIKDAEFILKKSDFDDANTKKKKK